MANANVLFNTPVASGGSNIAIGNLIQASDFERDASLQYDSAITTLYIPSANISGIANLGPVGNVVITGGSNTQVLSTNGLGVLTWVNRPQSSISAIAPTSPITGDFWYDTATSAGKIWDGAAWVIYNSSAVAVGLDAAKPAVGTTGALYYATDTDTGYIWDGAAWVPYNITAASVGLDAAKPATAATGALYYATDTLTGYVYDGAAWVAYNAGGAVSLTSNVITTTDNLGFNLTTTPNPITGTGVVSLTTPSVATLRTAANIGNVANLNLDSNIGNYLRGDGTWGPAAGGGAVSLTSNVITTTDNLGFNLTTTPNPITGTGVVSLTTPSVATLRTAANIGNVANINFDGSGLNVLYGNGVWAPAGGGGGTGVSSIAASTANAANITASPLGFELTSTPTNPLTAPGTMVLNVPSVADFRTNAGIGTVANINLDSNIGNYLRGDGTWGPAAGGGAVSLTSNVIATTAVTANNALGFDLTVSPSPITGTGVVSLNAPDVATFRTLANIGNVANINLDGNVGNALLGDGTWGPAPPALASAGPPLNVPVGGFVVATAVSSGVSMGAQSPGYIITTAPPSNPPPALGLSLEGPTEYLFGDGSTWICLGATGQIGGGSTGQCLWQRIA